MHVIKVSPSGSKSGCRQGSLHELASVLVLSSAHTFVAMLHYDVLGNHLVCEFSAQGPNHESSPSTA